MHIDFESSGGFANLQLTYHADTDALPQKQAEELLKLVESAGVFDLQQSDLTTAANGSPPDMLFYRLSVSEGSRQKTLTFNDATAPASLRPLLVLLQQLAVNARLKGT